MVATWTVGTLDELNPDLDYGILPWFGTDDNVKWITGAPGVGWSISSSAPNMDTAIEFMQYFATDDALKIFQEATGGLLAVAGIDYPVHPVINDGLPYFLDGNIYLPAIGWKHSDAMGRELQIGLHEVLLGNIEALDIIRNMDDTREELDAALD